MHVYAALYTHGAPVQTTWLRSRHGTVRHGSLAAAIDGNIKQSKLLPLSQVLCSSHGILLITKHTHMCLSFGKAWVAPTTGRLY
jgi:hypothetical protein